MIYSEEAIYTSIILQPFRSSKHIYTFAMLQNKRALRILNKRILKIKATSYV